MILAKTITEGDYIQPGKDVVMGHIEEKTYFISGS